MPRKPREEEPEDDFPEEEEEEEMDIAEISPVRKRKGPGRPRKGEPKLPDEVEEEEEEEEPEENNIQPRKQVRANWQLQRIPEIFRVVDPRTKKIIAEAYTIEELQLQLAIISAQHSTEAAKNTR